MLDAEELISRRNLKKKLNLWRVLALIAGLIALIVLFSKNISPNRYGPHIARVSIEGMITEDFKQIDLLRSLRKKKNVKAVILRINSPGGTTTGGEALYEQISRLREKSPVVAQFGTVATSAAYMTGISADYIFARSNTITGSVGVIMQWPELSDMLGKIGVNMKEIKSGALKAEPSPFHPLTDEAKATSQEMIDESHKWFVDLVKKRRSIRPEMIPGFLKGRVYSGRQAKTYGLIDEIGGQEEVKDWLTKVKKLDKNLKIVDYEPKDKNRLWFMGAFSNITNALYKQFIVDNPLKSGMYSVYNPRLLD